MLNEMYYILMNYRIGAYGFAILGVILCALMIFIVKKVFFGK